MKINESETFSTARLLPHGMDNYYNWLISPMMQRKFYYTGMVWEMYLGSATKVMDPLLFAPYLFKTIPLLSYRKIPLNVTERA